MNIGLGLKRMKPLRELRLLFHRCASDDSLKLLVEGIKRHPSLRFLSLTIDECILVTEDGLILIENMLKNLPLLERLELNIIKADLAGFWMKNLCKYLGKLTWLKSISLNFTSCVRVKDEGLNNLVECFKKLDSVKEISLNLNSYFGEIDFETKKSFVDVPVLQIKGCLF